MKFSTDKSDPPDTEDESSDDLVELGDDEAKLWESYDASAQQVVGRVPQLAMEWHHGTTRTEHLLLALIENPQRVGLMLEKLGVDVSHLRDELKQHMAADTSSIVAGPQELESLELSPPCMQAFQDAEDEAAAMSCTQISAEHLLLALLHLSLPKVPVWNRFFRWAGLPETAPAPLPEIGLRMLSAANLELSTARVVARDHLQIPVAGESSFFSIGVQNVITQAHKSLFDTRCGRISAGHLLLALLRDDYAANELLQPYNVPVEPSQLRAAISRAISSDGEIATAQPRFSPDARRVLTRARQMVQSGGYFVIDTQTLFLALLLYSRDASVQALREFGLDKKIAETLARQMTRSPKQSQQSASNDANSAHSKSINLAAFVLTWVCWSPAFALLNAMSPNAGGAAFIIAVILLAIPILACLVVCVLLLTNTPDHWKNAGLMHVVGLIAFCFTFALLTNVAKYFATFL